MRKSITALSLVAVTTAALAMPAMAQQGESFTVNAVPPVAGAAVGTAVGVGLYNGWYGSGVTAAALGATAGTAAVAGGVAGIGTLALIDAAVQPCRGFHALLGLNKDVCVNGEYVGQRTVVHRTPRRMR